MISPYEELSELVHEMEEQMRAAERCREEKDADGELLALSFASVITDRMHLLHERAVRDVHGARADIAWREGNDVRTRRFSVAMNQMKRREMPQSLLERLRSFAVGFDDARTRQPLRTTEDEAYHLGHRLGLSALGN